MAQTRVIGPNYRPTVSSQTKEDVVHNLQKLVTSNKSDLENGVVPLCLTPEVLLILNHGIEHLTGPHNGNGKMYGDLRYLQQALSSTQYLRLSHGGSTTIQAPVDLSIFHQLTQLDVKRVPPHWISGMNKFQERITLIRMSRCINYLEDVLGKNSDPNKISLSWNKLKKLYLANNFIKELDESLKLLPCLEVLDISQNYLTHTNHYLQYLSELVHLNLAYNSLSAIPTFSTSTSQRLKTLVLRANHLEHINGVEELVNLEILDLTSNVLCDHAVLFALYSMRSLKQLFLDDNPLSYNTRHRILTAASLNHKVVKKLSLDGQAFSESELKLSSSLRANIRPPPDNPTEPNPLFNGEEESQHSARPPRVRRVKSNIVNEICEIPQPGDDEDCVVDTADTSCDISGSPDLDYESSKRHTDTSLTKNRIETLREEFGDSWLQSFNGYQVNGAGSSSRPSVSETQPTVQSEDIAVSPAGSIAEGVQGSNITGSNTLEGEIPHSQYGSVVSEGEDIITHSALGEPDSKYGSVEEAEPTDAYSRHDTDNESTFSADVPEPDEASEDISEHDPFIVKLNDIYSEEFLITITDEKIIEKNIEGVITEMLDLSALTDVQPVEDEGRQMVKCKLDYFRKDRRERCYVMEDLSDSMRLVDILQPALAKTQSKRKSNETMECLKCGKRFQRKHSSKRRVHNGCIHCGSDMVIEVSAAQQIHSTPYGSTNSSPSGSPVPPKPKAKPKNSLPQNESSSSLYLSLMEEKDDMPTTLHSDDAETQSNPDSTVNGLSASREDRVDGQTGHDVEEKTRDIQLLSATPDSTVSYQSVEVEELVSDNSVLTDDQVGESRTHVLDPLTRYKFDFTDLRYIDHRLKLHLSVTYFEDCEQPECVVRCKYVEYARLDEHPLLLIFTNINLYILRIHNAINRRLDVGAQMHLVEKRLLSDILYIEIGLDHQNIRVEFEKTGYCFLLRDSDLGKLLHSNITLMLSGSAFNDKSKLKSILRINQEYYQHIGKCLPDVSRSDDGQSIAASYIAAFKQLPSFESCNIDLLEGCEPVSLVTDDTTLYILKEKYHLPFTRKRLPKKQSYFILDNSIPIGDIANLNVRRERCEVDIQGFDEQSLESIHRLVFVSPTSLMHFISALQGPWKRVYDVDLEVNYVP